MVTPSFSLRVKRLTTGPTKLHSLSFVGESLKKRAPLSAFRNGAKKKKKHLKAVLKKSESTVPLSYKLFRHPCFTL